MNRQKIKKTIKDLFLGGMLAAELAVVLDLILVVNGRTQSVPEFAAILAGLFLLLCLVPWRYRKWKKTMVWGILAVALVSGVAGFFCWRGVSEGSIYASRDQGKGQLYGNKNVMLLVPHQDDDINVLGGVMEEYVKYGSEVRVVFSTNGDYAGLAETRFREALSALGNVGIPEENVIFLGYGDQWDAAGPHLYNASSGEVMTSHLGRRSTYGTAAAGVYREGQPYTIDNFLQDIHDVILEHRPDVIYCVDYDYNIDHRALSHAFEKVMGRILREEPAYRPLVLKGYAYNTAWEAVNDFYGENLQATRNAYSYPDNPVPEVYHWTDRVRLPIHGEGLSRSLFTAELYKTLDRYESQGAGIHGTRIFNADKVFWQRRTDSLCTDARIRVSSGNGELLNDFMLLECHDLLNGLPYDGVWIPEGQGTASVIFDAPAAVSSVVLYDHPDGSKNVINARIDFDDGTSVETGPLYPNGAATVIPVETGTVSSFTVTLLDVQGEAGLTEIEAFTEADPWAPEFVKIMDEKENFVYDYWIDPSGKQTFELYDPSNMAGEFQVACDNSGCTVEVREGKISVECPAGESCTISVTGETGEELDSACIRNPGGLERGWKTLWLRMEKLVLDLMETKLIDQRLFVCRLYTKAAAKLGSVTG